MPRKIPASLTRAYNRAVKRQGDAAERAVKVALEEYMRENPDATVEEIRGFAIEMLEAAGDLHGNACSQAALELQDEIAREFGTKPPDIGGWLYEPDAESIEKTARYHAQKLVDGDVEGFVKEMADAARFYAERGANATMSETARKQDRDNRRSGRSGAVTHGVTFARVPMGATTCGFCLMLASRGFVYLSEESAGEFDRFHRHCDCRIVPGYPGMELEGYDPDEYYDRWKHPEKFLTKDQDVLAGVVRGEPMTFDEADRNRCNPHYEEGVRYQINCQSSVIAYEARRRGFDVEALPYSKGGKSEELASRTELAWFKAGTSETPEPTVNNLANTPRRFERHLEGTIKPGERYHLDFTWRNDINGHIVTIERDGSGQLMIYDPQNGKIKKDRELRNYLRRFSYDRDNLPRLLRVDELDFNKEYSGAVVKGSL